MDWQFEQRVFHIVFLMAQEKNKEIYLQLLSYTKSLTKRLPIPRHKQLLPQIMDALLV